MRQLVTFSAATGLSVLSAAFPAFGATIHVDELAIGANTGIDWQNAYTTLQAALLDADPGDVIWVAEGTYRLASQTGYVKLEDNVRLYGGFDGLPTNEILLEQRNIHKFETILSGDVGANDDPNDPFNPALTADNSFHVVECDSGIEDAWIDGFTITGGFADGTEGMGELNGGGMRVVTSHKITIANIIFKHNLSIKNGGGLFYTNGNALAALVNCSFIGNETDGSGGGVYIEGPIEQVTNCSFAANIAFAEGGGMANFSGTKIIVSQCSFSKNKAGAAETGRGSGLYCASGDDPAATTDDSTADIYNCIFWDNGYDPDVDFDAWVTASASNVEPTCGEIEPPYGDGRIGWFYNLNGPGPYHIINETLPFGELCDGRNIAIQGLLLQGPAKEQVLVDNCQFETSKYGVHVASDCEDIWFDEFDVDVGIGTTLADTYGIRGGVTKVHMRSGSMENNAHRAIFRMWSTIDGIVEDDTFGGGRFWLGGSSSDGPPIFGYSNVTFRNCGFTFQDDSTGCYDGDPDTPCVDPKGLDIKEKTHHVAFEGCSFLNFVPSQVFASFADAGGGIRAHNIKFIECTYSYNSETTNALTYDDLGVSEGNPQGILIVPTVPDADHREVQQFYAPNGYEGSSVLYSNIEGLIPYSDPANPATTFDTAGSGNIGDNLADDPLFADPFSNLRLQCNSPCIDAGSNALLPGEPGMVTGDAADLNYDNLPNQVLPRDLQLIDRKMDDPAINDTGQGTPPIVDMGAYEDRNCRPWHPDIFPTSATCGCGFGDAFVGAGDLAELLANWGQCPGCCADIAPVGNPNGRVDAGDLAELLANWGPPPPDCGGDGFGGGGGGDAGDAGEQDWLSVEMTDDLYDWIMTSPLDEIWEWLWSLLEG